MQQFTVELFKVLVYHCTTVHRAFLFLLKWIKLFAKYTIHIRKERESEGQRGRETERQKEGSSQRKGEIERERNKEKMKETY